METLAVQRCRGLAPSPVLYLNDVQEAAIRIGIDFSLVRYQILAYPERNNSCHSGIKRMIDHGDLFPLAERTIEDKRSLELIFRQGPQGQIEIRSISRSLRRNGSRGSDEMNPQAVKYSDIDYQRRERRSCSPCRVTTMWMTEAEQEFPGSVVSFSILG